MDTTAILHNTEHRPWPLPAEPWIMTQIWNDLLIPLVFVGSPGRRTVMANAYALADPYHLEPGRLLTAAALGSAPLLLLLLGFRRRVTDALALGAVSV